MTTLSIRYHNKHVVMSTTLTLLSMKNYKLIWNRKYRPNFASKAGVDLAFHGKSQNPKLAKSISKLSKKVY